MEIPEDDGTGNSEEGYPACNAPTGVEMPELMGQQEVFEMEEVTPQTEATGSLEPYRSDDGQDVSFLNPFDALYMPSTVLPATNHFTTSAPLTQTPLFPDASDDLATYNWNHMYTDMSYPPSFNDICNEAVGAVDKKSEDVELDEEQLRWMEEVFLA